MRGLAHLVKDEILHTARGDAVCCAGVEVPFELLLLSNRPLELLQLPRQCTLRLPGSWGEGTSGGSNLHSSWLNNPAFTLQLERKTRCK